MPDTDLATPLTAEEEAIVRQFAFTDERTSIPEHLWGRTLIKRLLNMLGPSAARQPVAETALREAARAVLTELDIIRRTSSDPATYPRLMVHIDTHNAFRAALATREPDPAPLDVERLARELIHVRGAHNPTAAELDADQEVRPCAWCRLAAEQAVEAAARLAHSKDEP